MTALANEIVLIADPRILAVPVIENHEPMVDLKDKADLRFGPSPEVPNNTDYTQMRKSVYEKLLTAQTLLPQRLQFCLYEGYRSLQLQKMLFDARYAKVKHAHADFSQSQLFTETTKMVSPVINPDGSSNIPPHSTGGAVDVYLIDQHGQAIDMGIHPQDWMGDTEGLLSATFSSLISKEALRNRAILYEVMTHVGFENYPTEYWHWSYGDRYWAYHQEKPHAIYSSVQSSVALESELELYVLE